VGVLGGVVKHTDVQVHEGELRRWSKGRGSRFVSTKEGNVPLPFTQEIAELPDRVRVKVTVTTVIELEES